MAEAHSPDAASSQGNAMAAPLQEERGSQRATCWAGLRADLRAELGLSYGLIYGELGLIDVQINGPSQRADLRAGGLSVGLGGGRSYGLIFGLSAWGLSTCLWGGALRFNQLIGSSGRGGV